LKDRRQFQFLEVIVAIFNFNVLLKVKSIIIDRYTAKRRKKHILDIGRQQFEENKGVKLK